MSPETQQFSLSALPTLLMSHPLLAASLGATETRPPTERAHEGRRLRAIPSLRDREATPPAYRPRSLDENRGLSGFDDRPPKLQALYQIALALTQSGGIERVEMLAADLAKPSEREAFLCAIAVCWARVGEVDRTLATIARVQDPGLQVRSWREAIVALTRGDRLADALEICEHLDPQARVAALCDLVVELRSLGHDDRALAMARTIPPAPQQVELFQWLAYEWAKVRDFDRVGQALATIADPSQEKAPPMVDLAVVLAGEGHLDLARELTLAIDRPAERSRVLAELAGAAIDRGETTRALSILHEAWQLCQPLPASAFKVVTIARISLEYAQAGATESSARILKEAIAAIETLKPKVSGRFPNRTGERLHATEYLNRDLPFNPFEDGAKTIARVRSLAREWVADVQGAAVPDGSEPTRSPREARGEFSPNSCALIANRDLQAALEIAQGIGNAERRAKALRAIGVNLARADRVETGVQAIAAIADRHQQAAGLRQIALLLLDKGKVFKARLVADAIADFQLQAETLGAIALNLSGRGQILEARMVAQTIGDRREQARILHQIALGLAEISQYNRSLQVSQSIDDRYAQARTLAAIAERLYAIGQGDRAAKILDSALELAELERFSS
ncbi:hypothetical protein JJD41_13685 [Oxynema sp. CENA135]|uniref:hypothetical protein n=1 Tax=Oxynema sp. CENA135 TaxID=984206 RepID=UPI0019091F08|nr:hypothetical protein [Oxynema sp. CENA135]MBK4730904.1 hypothetical protein [Oxynema sp. CENA135]